MENIKFPSIHDNVAPLEMGGVIARDGFVFQDHVAVQFCLKMLSDETLRQVRCESQDDITLIWQDEHDEEIEFVQVKGGTLNQLWSIAKLCEREKRSEKVSQQKDNSLGSSIIEKSLANDRFLQGSRFRIVTRRDLNSDLQILKLPFSSPLRLSTNGDLEKLSSALTERIAEFKSPKGHGANFWVLKTLWEVEYDSEVLKRKNINSLRRFVENLGGYLPTSQEDALYDVLLKKVQDAACADWRIEPSAKQIESDNFLLWLKQHIQETQRTSPLTPGRKMQEKMEDVRLPEDYIESAHRALKLYRQETLQPKYLDTSSRELIEGEVSAILQDLRSDLDIGKLSSSGVEFHAACLSRLKELQASLPLEPKPTLSFLHGCMYFITGRCGHRFRRIEP